jgi:hypothetical protein
MLHYFYRHYMNNFISGGASSIGTSPTNGGADLTVALERSLIVYTSAAEFG